MILKSDGLTFVAVDAQEMVSILHAASFMQEITDDEWMRLAAQRACLQTGRRIRSDNPDTFIADLITAGLLERETIN